MRQVSQGSWPARCALGLALAGLLGTLGASAADDAATAALRQIVNGTHRSAEHKARDQYRHPVETLTFFGINPRMTVVELWPFGGWYTEILAPYLRDHGQLYAAAMDPQSTNREDLQYNADLRALFAAHPELFDKVRVTVLAPGKMQKDVFAAAVRALKPGGVLGVEEHRSNDPNFVPRHQGEAYVGEQYAIDLIQSVGFKLVARSDVNRNPKDTKDYPKGVWTLPPFYAEGEKDRAKYAAIGESDRFTLKFVKPKS
jgi:predicted methyltransferase